MNPSIYRDPVEGARLRLHAGLEVEQSQLGEMIEPGAVLARRAARIAGGGMMVVVGLALFASALGIGINSAANRLMAFSWLLQRHTGIGLLSLLLVGAWPLAALAYGTAYAGYRTWASGARRKWQRYLERSHAATLSDDIFTALARLEVVASPVAQLRRRSARMEAASVALPLIGLSLITPLTLHLIAIAVLDGPHASHASGGMGHVLPRCVREMHDWIKTSVLVVGHAHVALAICGIVFARRLRTQTPESLRGWGWRGLGIAVLVSAIPGIMFLAVPPLLVAVTGVVFIPAMYGGLLGLVVRERASLTQVSLTEAWAASPTAECSPPPAPAA